VGRRSLLSRGHLLHSFWRWRLNGDRRGLNQDGAIPVLFSSAVLLGLAQTALAGHEGWAVELSPACRLRAEGRARRSIRGEGFLDVLLALYR
jgi:hypothetical protein